MTFREENTDEFLDLFNKKKAMIRNFDGCIHLELLKDINQPSIYFTYSFWEDESYLQKYRNSELFAETWKMTKKLFAEKAEAWSVEEI